MKNVGTLRVDGGIFDSRGQHPSANLFITVKDFHTNADGNSKPFVLSIYSLNDAYEAYKIINELASGSNESHRIKIEE